MWIIPKKIGRYRPSMCPHTKKKSVEGRYRPSQPPSVCKFTLASSDFASHHDLLSRTWRRQANSSSRIQRSKAATSDHPRRNLLQWFRMETVRCASPGLLGAHCSLALPRVTHVGHFKRLAFGPGRVFPRSQEKKDHDVWSHMVPEVMGNGPGYTSTKETWSHEWWEMVSTSIWMSIPIHRFIDPVD